MFITRGNSVKDIFISHSSKDEDTATKIYKLFEDNGLSCWASFCHDDLGMGDTYTEKIAEAIRNSKIFVVLLSSNSVMSEQVHQEVIMANDNQKYGLKIVALVLDESLEQNYYHPKIDLVLAGKETITWCRDNEKHILEKMGDLIEYKFEKSRAQIICTDIPKAFFCGRENEMLEIDSALDSYRKVCLYGIGGIGKTSIVEEIGLKEKVNSTVIYAQVDKGILNVLSDDNLIKIEAEDLLEAKRSMSDYMYAMYKYNLLKVNLGKNDLLILDNVDLDAEPFLDKILELDCKVLFTTRKKSTKKQLKIKYIEIKGIKDEQVLESVFCEYYKKQVEENQIKDLKKIFELVNYHTLSVVLLGQQMNYWGENPSDYLADTNFSITRKHLKNTEISDELSDMYKVISGLMDVSILAKSERKVLKIMTLLPIQGYLRIGFLRLMGDEYEETISKLEQQGWICSKDNAYIYLHPIIREIIINEYDLQFEDSELKSFIDKVINMIDNSWNKSYEDNIAQKELVLSIYFNFPNPTIYSFRKYLVISKFLWIINCMDVSVEIQNKVKLLFINEEGKHVNTIDEGETAIQLGFTYHGKGEYAEAVKELTTAVKIFGNKYASALSHLAQAKMYADKGCSLESIEELLSDSLEIRKKYCANARNEAASNHLYAKVLSNYNTRLDEAIAMEKSALQFFKKEDPDGVNVSSAEYILGWLYVQSAVDEEDIEFGIEYLEKAKNIRLRHRGDELHPWMEDIYQKLGLSYIRVNDFLKACEYFELLEKVQKKKYANDIFSKELYDTYGNLTKVYGALGRKEDEMKYKKLQKYYE